MGPVLARQKDVLHGPLFSQRRCCTHRGVHSPFERSKPFPKLEASGGIPDEHVKAFQLTADLTSTVIITRGLNPLSAGLILEGYAPKGFMNKAKSCNWGPMSGFVINDPRMGKIAPDAPDRKAVMDKQKAAIVKGLDHEHLSVLVPVCISAARHDDLVRNGLVLVVRHDENRIDVLARQKGGELFHFTLLKASAKTLKGSRGKDLYCVFFGRDESSSEQVLTRLQSDKTTTAIQKGQHGTIDVGLPDTDLVPVLGMGNREIQPSANGGGLAEDATNIGLEQLGGKAYGEIYPGVLKAVAGDYDLWAVLDDTLLPADSPMRLDFKRGVRLTRPERRGGPSAKASELKKENSNLGNISPAVQHVGRVLNEKFKQFLVVHSDYGGNPFYDLDFPLIAFVPHSKKQLRTVGQVTTLKPNMVCIQNDGKDKGELAAFLRLVLFDLKFCAFRAHRNLWDEAPSVNDADRITQEWKSKKDATMSDLRARMYQTCNLHDAAEQRISVDLPLTRPSADENVAAPSSDQLYNCAV